MVVLLIFLVIVVVVEVGLVLLVIGSVLLGGVVVVGIGSLWGDVSKMDEQVKVKMELWIMFDFIVLCKKCLFEQIGKFVWSWYGVSWFVY